MNYFITAIDTNIGKTLVSSILVQHLGFDYWKPIQSGTEEPTDTQVVQSLVTREDIVYFKEAYTLSQPLSPHASAAIDGVSISLNAFKMPKSDRLIIEGAGGIMVPLNASGDCVLDLIKQLPCEVIIVTKNYLGSINHTLMTCKILKDAGVSVKGLVITGERNETSESIITKITNLPIILTIPTMSSVSKSSIAASELDWSRW